MTGGHDALRAAVAEVAARGGPATVGLMQVLIQASDEAAARTLLRSGIGEREAAGDPAGAARLRALLDLWAAHPAAWSTVRGAIAAIAHDAPRGAADDGLRDLASAFDRLVAASPEASVALYSLGSADLLAAATGEIVELMRAWRLFGPGTDLLDLGCGIGRFAPALGPHVRSFTGLDLSPGMIGEARRRHGALPNARFLVGSGRDLAPVEAGSLDLILAADVFPYLVGAGLADTHIAEMARVLRPGGRALILNFSYRGNADRDRREVADAARLAGLRLLRAGTRDLRSWDAPAFLLSAP